MQAAAPGKKYPPAFGSKQRPVAYRLRVDESTETVVVSATPNRLSFKEGEWVKFSSNDPDTAIRFVGKSPFYNKEEKKGELKAGVPFPLGKSGKILQIQCPKGITRFECGYMEGGNFEAWHGEGSDFPGGGY